MDPAVPLGGLQPAGAVGARDAGAGAPPPPRGGADRHRVRSRRSRRGDPDRPFRTAAAVRQRPVRRCTRAARGQASVRGRLARRGHWHQRPGHGVARPRRGARPARRAGGRARLRSRLRPLRQRTVPVRAVRLGVLSSKLRGARALARTARDDPGGAWAGRGGALSRRGAGAVPDHPRRARGHGRPHPAARAAAAGAARQGAPVPSRRAARLGRVRYPRVGARADGEGAARGGRTLRLSDDDQAGRFGALSRSTTTPRPMPLSSACRTGPGTRCWPSRWWPARNL